MLILQHDQAAEDRVGEKGEAQDGDEEELSAQKDADEESSHGDLSIGGGSGGPGRLGRHDVMSFVCSTTIDVQ
jgi:hypothetical protein